MSGEPQGHPVLPVDDRVRRTLLAGEDALLVALRALQSDPRLSAPGPDHAALVEVTVGGALLRDLMLSYATQASVQLAQLQAFVLQVDDVMAWARRADVSDVLGSLDAIRARYLTMCGAGLQFLRLRDWPMDDAPVH